MTEHKTIDLLDIILVLLNKWKKVLTIMTLFTTIGLIVALIWPQKFKTDLTYIVNSGNSINFQGIIAPAQLQPKIKKNNVIWPLYMFDSLIGTFKG